MNGIRCVLVLLMALCSAPSHADEIGAGFSISEYPELVLVPDYPVYYAPAVAANYFFYDGNFWMYQDDDWYQSPWYDGPWERIAPEDVPDVLLQVPVRYYVQPPAYFFSWWYDDPPRWGEHWGREWERHRHGWDRRDHRIHDKPAPLPGYQQHYSGEHYPRHRERQHELQEQHYHHQAQNPLVPQHRPGQPLQSAPAAHNPNSVPQAASSTQRERVKEQPARTEAQTHAQQRPPENVRREENMHRSEGTESRRTKRDADQEQNRAQEKERSRER